MKKKHVAAKASPSPCPAPRTAPVEQLHQCPACPRVVPLLVEGSDLCVSCDRRYYPDLVHS